MRFVKENLATLVAATCVVAVLLTAALLFGPWQGGACKGVAIVHDGDGNTHELPLSHDATLEVSTSLGRNVLIVEHGKVRMLQADCPKGSCMQQAAISAPGEQIICLPHKLWVEIADKNSAGGALDKDTVSWQDESNSSVDLVAR